MTKMEGLNICLYGINRSLDVTIESIRPKILEQAKKLSKNVYFSAAFNIRKSGVIYSKRSGEQSKSLSDSHRTLLPEFKLLEINQDEFDAYYPWEDVLRNGDHYNDDGSSIKNMMRALNALNHSFYGLPEHARTNYPTLFVRPDLEIIGDLNLRDYLSICCNNSIVVPTWHSWSGINDRFAICSPGYASKSYASRIMYVNNFIEITSAPLHPERYLSDLMHLLRIIPLPVISTKFVRIRAERAIHFEPNFFDDKLPYDSSTQAWLCLSERLASSLAEIEQLKLSIKASKKPSIQKLTKTIFKIKSIPSILKNCIYKRSEK